jgi:hypothetical protein
MHLFAFKKYPFRPFIFFLSINILVLFFIPSFIAAGAEDEGTGGNGLFSQFLIACFSVLRFPTHTLLWNIFSSSVILWVGGIAINILFYSFLLERTISVFRKKRENS